MNEYLMLEIARQRSAEWRESARLAGLARLAREQRAADRAERRRNGKVCGVTAHGDELVGLSPIPDHVAGAFATDPRSTSAGHAAARC